MSLTDPLKEWPALYQAGTTLKVERSYADFPAGTWALKVVFQGRVKFEKIAGASGTKHLFDIVATDTDTELPAGVYKWAEIASSGALKYVVAEGAITVEASFEGATSGALQLAVEKELEAVEARIAERLAVGGDVEEMSIGDRHARLVELDALYKRRNFLQAELRRIAAGGTFSRQVVVEFTGTGLRH